MSTVEERGTHIYEYLKARLGKKYSIHQLCKALDLYPGAKTAAGIRYARDLAVADGLHFPPAVPANGFTYTVTSLAEDALDPTLHMSRIEAGVRIRADVGYEFMRHHERNLPKELKPIVKAALAMQSSARRAQAEAQRTMDDMVVELVKLRRETR
jgi:hypothetical protein